MAMMPVNLDEGIKYLYGSVSEENVSPNSSFTVTIPTPQDAKEKLAVIPVGVVPSDTWSGVYTVWVTGTSLSTITCRTYGTGAAHTYAVRYLLIYR